MEKITIIISIYNTEKVIRKTLDSILEQTYSAFELVLIDDGSTDESGRICDFYAKRDDRIKVIHQDNLGTRKSRLLGVQVSTCKYVTFIDGDDWVEADTIEKLMKQAKEYKSDIIIGSYVVEDENGIVCKFSVSEPSVMNSCTGIFNMFVGKNFNWSMCNKVYKKELFDDIDINTLSNESYGEDTFYNYLLFRKAKKICYIPNAGYHYVVRSDSLTHKPFSKRQFVYIDQWIDIINDCRIRGDLDIVNAVSNLLLTDGMTIINKAQTIYGRDDEDTQKAAQQIINAVDANYPNRYLYKNALWSSKTTSALASFYKCRKEELKKLLNDDSKIYLYGAGRIATEVAIFLEENKVDYFPVVTNTNGELFRCKYVKNYSEVILNEKDIVILALSEKNKNEVIDNIKHGNVLDFGKYSMYY